MTFEISFTPDDKVSVHAEGAIRHICAPFRSHEAGLPEWIKNSSDAYARADIGGDEAIVLVLLQDGKSGASAIVGCLDFAGMSAADIEEKFRHWADPNAAGDEEGVEGGHGNGGKCYMTQLFEEYSYLHTLSGGRANKYGFKGGSAIPGYFPSPTKGRDYKVENAEAELAAALRTFGVRLGDLPAAARALYAKRKAFTLALGVGAKSLTTKRIPKARWIENLQGHQQMVRPIQRNRVLVYHNGKLLPAANPLILDEIMPIPGAEAAHVIPIPAELTDPRTGDLVATGAAQNQSRLELRTSDKSMRHSLKARHTINGWTHAGRSTGFWEVQALSRAPYAPKIYGDIYLNDLSEYKQNDRRNHSDAPLTRALQEWLTTQIDEYSSEFVKLDDLNTSKEEQDELSRLNEALNRWKDTFLQQEFGGTGSNTDSGTDDDTDREPLPRDEVSRVAISLSHTLAGQGVTFRPSVRFFNSDSERVRAVAHEWHSTDEAVARADGELRTITTNKPGKTAITVRCKGSGVVSNALDIEVLDIAKIELVPDKIELPAGSRHPVKAVVNTKDGRTAEGVYLVWTENDRTVASVSSGGMVFGLTPGATEVTAGDDEAVAETPTQVRVRDPKEAGNKGSGFPRILLSEIDRDPLGEGSPRFSKADAPVLQRAQDVEANIWWINMASPLARRYIDTAKGGGAKSREWRVYLLERYIEVMVKILLTYDFNHGEQLTFETMWRRWEEEATNMQQRASDSLTGYLEGREVQEAA